MHCRQRPLYYDGWKTGDGRTARSGKHPSTAMYRKALAEEVDAQQVSCQSSASLLSGCGVAARSRCGLRLETRAAGGPENKGQPHVRKPHRRRTQEWDWAILTSEYTDAEGWQYGRCLLGRLGTVRLGGRAQQGMWDCVKRRQWVQKKDADLVLANAKVGGSWVVKKDCSPPPG